MIDSVALNNRVKISVISKEYNIYLVTNLRWVLIIQLLHVQPIYSCPHYSFIDKQL